ncbi:MAG TPA: C25 family cysteine peptidase, partial [Bacteroidales bacterium]
MKGASQANEPGKPDLPSYFHTFYVPKEKLVTGVTFKGLNPRVVEIGDVIVPTQHPIPISKAGIDTAFDFPDPAIYNADLTFPEKQAEVVSTDFMDGDIQLVKVQVYPMSYQPKSNKLVVYDNYEISLETTSNPDTKSFGHKRIITKKHDQATIDLVKTMVENPSDVPTAEKLNAQIVTSKLKSASTTSWSVPFYEYVVITSRALSPAFQDLITWKKRKGYNAGIVYIEDIIADPVAVGDNVSQLNDNAGKLRQYLFDGVDVIKYVLLGGDYNIVPVRYGAGNSNTWGTDNDGKIPSDLYYSDLSSNWNVDGDAYTGERDGDALDYSAEIYVGRLLCNTVEDVYRWTEKLKKYEINPGNGDRAYLSKWLASQADDMQDNFEAESVSSTLPSFFSTKIIINEVPSYNAAWPTYPKGADVITKINERWGLYSNFNHGCSYGYGTATHGNANPDHLQHANYNVMYKSNLPEISPYTVIPESNNGMDKLTNSDYPTIIYSISCENVPFDDYKTPIGWRNLGEAFLCMYNSGGPAYLGNTRYGWVTFSSELYKVFNQKLAITNNIGITEASSKYDFYCWPDVQHWLKLTHNLLGCPEMPVWTATPSTFLPTITESGSTITVVPGAANSTITVMSALDNGATYFSTQNVSSNYAFYNVPKPYYVTITKTNYIPYLKNPGAV